MAWVLGPKPYYGNGDKKHPYMLLCNPHTADSSIAASDFGLLVNSDEQIRVLTRYEAMTIKFALRARGNQIFDHTRQGRPIPPLNFEAWYVQEVVRIRALRPELQYHHSW